MSITIRTTGAKDYGRWIKALIVGPPGAGKTIMSSTFPDALFASAEGGLMSIADRRQKYVEIKTSDELLQLKYAIDQEPAVRQDLLGFPVETVVVDTIDEIQRILIRERLDSQKKESMSLPDWGWLGEQMQAIIRGFRNLPMHVVFTCHSKEVTDQESGRLYFKPGLQGAIGDQIPAYVDLAVLLRAQMTTIIEDGEAKKKMVRVLQTFPDAQHDWIKDRSGKLPHEVPIDFESDFKRLHAAIFSDIEELPVSSPEVAVEEPPIVPSEPPQVTAPAPPAETEPTIVAEPKEQVAEPVAPAIPQEAVVQPGLPIEKAAPAVKAPVCEECQTEITQDQADLSRIRHRAILCRPHFKERSEKKR